jgi:predicted aminopeptidase
VKSIGIRLSFAVVALSALASCSTVEYLWQAGRGQLAIMNRARPIDEVLRDQTTPPDTKKLLAEVERIRAYGEKAGLRPTSNYREYVKLDRDAVVYVVSACHPLRFEPKEWTFPIVGGFPYLGWYDRPNAERYASRLRGEGFDVDVRGAPAYSTLGWFRDPILSTMIPEGPRAIGELVEVVLHESLHATVYINHQAFFNESLASFVAEKLTPIYLRETRGPNSTEEKAYLEGLAYQEKYYRRMHEAYVELDALYQSAAPDDEKRARKTAVLTQLRKDLRIREGRDLNNATLVGHREYGGNRDVFERAFEKCGRDWGRFLRALGNVDSKVFKEKQEKDLTAFEAAFTCS